MPNRTKPRNDRASTESKPRSSARPPVRSAGLALAIARPGHAPLSWEALLPLMAEFWQLIKAHIEPRARAGRLKQWLNYLRRRYPQAEAAYAAVRTVNDPMVVSERLFGAVCASGSTLQSRSTDP